MSSLTDLADKWGSDKGTTPLRTPEGSLKDPGHNYTPLYEQLLKGREIKKLLEIGIFYGASLRMWAEYFPEARIYGIDWWAWTMINEGRIHSFICDQRDTANLRQIAEYHCGGNLDLIIDDGSHVPQDQVTSALALVPYLSPTGIYVIEDVLKESVPWMQSQLPWPLKVLDVPDTPLANGRLLVISRDGLI